MPEKKQRAETPLMPIRRLLTIALLAALCGCGYQGTTGLLPPLLQDVDDIRNDNDLTAQEKREALLELGLDDVTINGILVTERTGNQFGGTLTTAFNKVVAETFTTLTPDEVQLYGDATATANFTDNDARDIVTLFGSENINTPDELTAFLDNPGVEIPEGIGVEDLRAVFVDTDPDALIDLLP